MSANVLKKHMCMHTHIHKHMSIRHNTYVFLNLFFPCLFTLNSKDLLFWTKLSAKDYVLLLKDTMVYLSIHFWVDISIVTKKHSSSKLLTHTFNHSLTPKGRLPECSEVCIFSFSKWSPNCSLKCLHTLVPPLIKWWGLLSHTCFITQCNFMYKRHHVTL